MSCFREQKEKKKLDRVAFEIVRYEHNPTTLQTQKKAKDVC